VIKDKNKLDILEKMDGCSYRKLIALIPILWIDILTSLEFQCAYVILQDTENEINLCSKCSETSLIVHSIKSPTKKGWREGDIAQMKQSKIWANEFHSTEVSFLASHGYPGVSYSSQIQTVFCI